MRIMALMLVMCFAALAQDVGKTQDVVRVQVKFTIVDEKGIQFTDALYYTQAQYATLKPTDLAAEKTKRFDVWKAAVAAAPKPVEPTKEELQAELVVKEAEVVELKAKITAAAAKEK